MIKLFVNQKNTCISVTRKKCRPVLHHCEVIFFWSSWIMEWDHALLLMNGFNKTEAAVFSCRLCFLRAFPFISLILLVFIYFDCHKTTLILYDCQTNFLWKCWVIKVVRHIEMPKAAPKKSFCHFQKLEMILKWNKQNTVRLPQKYPFLLIKHKINC